MSDSNHSQQEGIQLDDRVAEIISQIGHWHLQWNDVEVVLSEPELLHDYTSALWNRVKVERGDKFTVSEQDLVKYFMTLVWLRVRYVRDESHLTRDYDRFLVIPSFMSQYLRQVGVVISDGLGVRLLPQMEDEYILPPEKAQAISQQLRPIGSHGIGFSDTPPRDKRGNWDFMSMQYVEDQTASHSDSVHPGIAMAASFVRMHQAQQVMNPLVSYGDLSSYRRVVSGLVQDGA